MSDSTPICRCRVLYLGSAVPRQSKDGLQGIQVKVNIDVYTVQSYNPGYDFRSPCAASIPARERSAPKESTRGSVCGATGFYWRTSMRTGNK